MLDAQADVMIGRRIRAHPGAGLATSSNGLEAGSPEVADAKDVEMVVLCLRSPTLRKEAQPSNLRCPLQLVQAALRDSLDAFSEGFCGEKNFFTQYLHSTTDRQVDVNDVSLAQQLNAHSC
eukprot:6172370-Pleurochrysis_carterae.AAC.1